MKNKIALFITGCITLLLVSCLDSDDEGTTIVIKDAQIKSISLSHDSIPELKNLKFTIDQINGLIYNKDSMAYGTEIGKVVCNITYVVSAVSGTELIVGDSTYWWNGSDSVDFSKPIKINVTAYDRTTIKSYTAKVNVHQVLPDSMVWNLYADHITGGTADDQKVITHTYNDAETYFIYTRSGTTYNLYTAPVSDAVGWTELSLNGLPDQELMINQMSIYEGVVYVASVDGTLYESIDGLNWSASENAPSVKYILGALDEGVNQLSALATIIEEDDDLYFARMDKDSQWRTGNMVPDGFPVVGFGNLCFTNTYHQYLAVVAGKDKNNNLLNNAWSTMNATEWYVLTDEEADFFDPREGAMLTFYDDKFFLTGGIDALGNGMKDIYLSKDYGITWAKEDSLLIFPKEYKARGYGTIHVDDNNYMLIFGGKTSKNAKALDEIWRGRINRLGFKD